MGQIAEDIINGLHCDSCGCYFRKSNVPQEECEKDEFYEHGYPATCWDCWDDMNAQERKDHQRALVPTF